jgi:hypothetical protein
VGREVERVSGGTTEPHVELAVRGGGGEAPWSEEE